MKKNRQMCVAHPFLTFFHLEKLHSFEWVKLLFTNLVAIAFISFDSFFCHQFDMLLKGM
jgi:hypothetical protein